MSEKVSVRPYKSKIWNLESVVMAKKARSENASVAVVAAAEQPAAASVDVTSPKYRQKLAQRLSPAARQVVEEGLALFAKFSGGAVFYQLRLGQLLKGYADDPKLTQEQKSEELANMAIIWNQPQLAQRHMYDLINVAEAFTLDDLLSLELLIQPDSKSMPRARQMANGHYVTWTHLLELQKVETKRRKGLVTQLLKNGWSSHELRLNIQGEKLVVNTRAGGRLPSVPKNPVAMVRKLQLTVQQSRRYMDAAAHPLETAILELKGELPPALLEEINTALRQLDAAEEIAKQTRQRLLRVREKANGNELVKPVSPKKRKAKPVEEEEPSEDFDAAVASNPAAMSGFDDAGEDEFSATGDAESDDFDVDDVDAAANDDEDFSDDDDAVTVDDEFDE